MHRQRHDAMINGVRTPPLKSDQFIVADADDDFSVSLVTPQSHLAQRIRAEKVARLGKREMGYDFAAFTRYDGNDINQAHAFLGHHARRAIGLVVFRYREVIWRATWEEWAAKQNMDEQTFDPAKQWAVDFVWIHQAHRRQGLAMRLITVAAAYLQRDVQALSWTIPFSDAGEHLARRCSPYCLSIAGW